MVKNETQSSFNQIVEAYVNQQIIDSITLEGMFDSVINQPIEPSHKNEIIGAILIAIAIGIIIASIIFLPALIPVGGIVAGSIGTAIAESFGALISTAIAYVMVSMLAVLAGVGAILSAVAGVSMIDEAYHEKTVMEQWTEQNNSAYDWSSIRDKALSADPEVSPESAAVANVVKQADRENNALSAVSTLR